MSELTEVRLLGPTEVWSAGERVAVRGAHTRAVLAILALNANRVVSSDWIIDVLWETDPPPSAAGQVQTAVWRLRRALGNVIETLPAGYLLRLDSSAMLDVTRFEENLAAGRAAAEEGRAQAASELLRAGLELWRGPALADVPALSAHAACLEEQRLVALETRFEAELALGSHACIVGELTALTEQLPLREKFHGQLMTALHRSGRSAEALAVFRRLRACLRSEVGLEPSPELCALERQVLAQEPGLQDPQASAEVACPDPIYEEASQVPQTRYARVDGLHVAYQTLGSGTTDVVLVPGTLSHLDLWWAEERTARFHRRLATFGRLILFDKRGTGLSDRPGRTQTLDDFVEDVRVVMNAAGSERAVLVGYSEGGAVCLRFAATFPERVSHLVLAGSAARWSWAADYPHGESADEMFGALERICEREWGRGSTIDWYVPSLAHSGHARALVGRRERMSLSPNDYLRMLRVMREIDVRPDLPSVHQPVLVVQRTDDRITPPGHGRYLADHLPNASYVEHPGDHTLWLGRTERFFGALDAFLVETSRPASRKASSA